MKIWRIATKPIIRFSTLPDSDKNTIAKFLVGLTRWVQNMSVYSVDETRQMFVNEYISLPQFFKDIIAYRGQLSSLFRGEQLTRYDVKKDYTKYYSIVSFSSQTGAGWFAGSKKETINGSEIVSYLGSCSLPSLTRWASYGNNENAVNDYLDKQGDFVEIGDDEGEVLFFNATIKLNDISIRALKEIKVNYLRNLLKEEMAVADRMQQRLSEQEVQKYWQSEEGKEHKEYIDKLQNQIVILEKL